MARALAVVAAAAASPVLASWCGGVPTASAGAAVASRGFRPVVVEARRVTVPGPQGLGAPGPFPVDATLPRPTRAGDLLVAAVIDGVRTSGMRQPSWHLPGWRRAGDVIGGNTAGGGSGGYATGGLQAAIFYRPDCPGRLTTVRLGTVPGGTDADVTAVVAEIAGVPRQLAVAGTGSSTSGPTPATDSTASAVTLRRLAGGRPVLVLAAFTNGGTAPHGERWVRPPGWRVVGQDRSLDGIDQPLLFDESVWGSPPAPRQAVRYVGGRPIDNCALMVAFS